MGKQGVRGFSLFASSLPLHREELGPSSVFKLPHILSCRSKIANPGNSRSERKNHNSRMEMVIRGC